MKYIIMCGGDYSDQFKIPKPLLIVDNEILVERTIRLLKENGIKDIAISTDIKDYNYLGVEILKNKNKYIHDVHGNVKKSDNCWLTAYYPLKTPACYLAGDVYWTESAIKKIVNTEIENTMFICAPDWQDGRKNPTIKGREPLGYIVQNQEVFRTAINEIMKEIDEGKFTYDPVAWNLYRKLNGIKMDYNGFGNDIFNTQGDFMVIDDLTTDIDLQKNIPALEKLILIERGEEKMVKVQVIEDFHLGKFNELKNIERANKEKNTKGHLYAGDIFECTDDMAEYLMNEEGHKNPANRAFVDKVPMEVIPEKEEQDEDKVEKPKRITKRRKPVAKK